MPADDAIGMLDAIEAGLDPVRRVRGFEHGDAAAGIDPIQHYLDAGWHEQRDPSLLFSTRFYMDNNPDVVAAGVNPFFHFIAAGKAEGRHGKHQLGFRWDILAKLKPVAEQIAEMKAHRGQAMISPAEMLASALQTGLAGARKLVVSFSHDAFTKHVGGVQLLLRRELQLFRDRGDAHVHLYPEYPLPFIDASGEAISLGMLVNGKHAGFHRARDIAAALGRARPATLEANFVIHSLLGHNVDQTADLLDRCGLREGLLWLHDYSPIYNNFKLLRNDVAYGGFPREGTIARELCEFARADFCHAREFAKLFDRFRVRLVSPSQAALDVWKDAGVLQAASDHVIEHVKLVPEGASVAPVQAEARPLRIGFLGYPAVHKGWPVFQELVLNFRDDPRYEFHHLGSGRVGGLPLQFHEVSACESRPDAMSEAVAAADLDVVLLWSIWPETFCLTAYEAIAAGAFLVANPDSGNVAAAIAKTGQGLTLPSEAALRTAMAAGDLAAHARTRRTVSRFRMEYGALSLELMD
ncbi:MAG: hypothetical protein CFE32_17430 [Alphaproteobacteria bacterium PA3]|nr:MAG: hypothetical protein CFE32_17430 [Alphaproteobacteria bacterium PA3]